MADPPGHDLPFDVFLSHNSKDKPAVRALAALLTQRGLRVWLDEQQLEGGSAWQARLEAAIRDSEAGAVLIGADGLGPWQDMEMQLLLSSAATGRKRVIPVLLPAAPAKPDLPGFLSLFTWVDLRRGFSEQGVAGLIRAILEAPASPRPATYPARGIEVATTRLPHGAEMLFGRDHELARLDVAWDDPKTHVVTLVAWGGVGKTALVVAWMARLAADGYRGAQRVFDWSFYSQGTRDQGEASADLFVAKALEFFGDPDPTLGSPWDKGERLARLVAARKTLLVLDGVEPLQHPPGPYTGKLKDPALGAMLKGLAQHNPGLCVVTTREPLVDLGPFHAGTAPEWPLERLSEPAGAALLHRLGTNRSGQSPLGPGDPELCQASREVQGHALTLQLLGRYLAKAHQGDVRRRDQVRFEEADAKIQGGYAFKVMAAYERWLASSGEQGRQSLAVWRLLGLFDRPADPGPLGAICQPPAIPGLTDPLVGLSEPDWNLAVSNLEEIGLVTASPYEPKRVKGFSKEQVRWSGNRGTALGEPAEFVLPESPGRAFGGRSLEAHPLVREYFAAQVRRTSPASWQEAHRRLYAHLIASVPFWPEGSAGLQPLYQAVAHGCQAGLHQEVSDEVHFARILRGNDKYSVFKLGLFAADLGAVACLFDRPWQAPAPALPEPDQAWLLNEAAFNLRALGRLQEALEPMRAGLRMGVEQKAWKNAAIAAGNLSELELTLGDVPGAVRDAQECVELADRSDDAFQKMATRTTRADALHQAGRQAEALELFRQAEVMQAERQREYPLLYSLPGFRYCDLLLSEPERAAWGVSTRWGLSQFSRSENGTVPLGNPVPPGDSALLARCREVEERARKMFEWRVPSDSLLDIALDHLTLGRAALYRAVLRGAPMAPQPIAGEAETGAKPTGCNPWALSAAPEMADALQTAAGELAAAVDGLRSAGRQDHLPRALVSRVWLRWLQGDAAGARADLDEAWQIAERGGMRLFMADVLLYRARLPLPGTDPAAARADLAAARTLIDQCAYLHRLPELEDAEAAWG